MGDKTVDIPSSAITNNVLEFALPSEMNGKTLTTAMYSINGIAGDVTQPTTVASAHARFIGDNGITDTDSPSFTIDSPKLKFTPTTALNTTINKGQDAKIEGTVAYTDTNQTLQNSNMVIHTIVNGGSEKLIPMSDTSSVQGQVIDNISHSDLIDGTNTVEVYITDKSGTSIFSNHETFIISTKNGGLSINEYPKSVDFQTVNTTRADQIINRSGNWNLSVLDSRDTGNHWRLTASSTKLQNSSSDFDGSLIFKSGNNTSSLTENNVTIASGKTNSNKPITDIDSTWDSDSGVLLKSNGSNAAGTYQGTINWTLYDSI